MEKIKKMIIIMCVIMLILLIVLVCILNVNKSNNINVSNKNVAENTDSDENVTSNDSNINEKNFYTVVYLVEKYAGDENLTFVPFDMRLNKGKNVDKYLVDGYFVNSNYKVLERMFLYVNIDNSNKTFSIEKLNRENINFDELKIKNDDNNIEKKATNYFSNDVIDEGYIIKKIFNNLKTNLIVSNKYVYLNLEEQYKKTKFNDENIYKQYIENNLEKYKSMDLLKYVKEEKNGEIIYTLINNYYDSYVIISKNYNTKYSIRLDNYTIITDDMQEKYNKASLKKKIYTNTENFINMINNKDYESAYSLLEEDYKNDKFARKDLFEKYIKDKLFNYNIISTISDEVKGNDKEYMYSVTIKDGIGVSANQKDITIIIKLEDNAIYRIQIKE